MVCLITDNCRLTTKSYVRRIYFADHLYLKNMNLFFRGNQCKSVVKTGDRI